PWRLPRLRHRPAPPQRQQRNPLLVSPAATHLTQTLATTSGPLLRLGTGQMQVSNPKQTQKQTQKQKQKLTTTPCRRTAPRTAPPARTTAAASTWPTCPSPAAVACPAAASTLRGLSDGSTCLL